MEKCKCYNCQMEFTVPQGTCYCCPCCGETYGLHFEDQEEGTNYWYNLELTDFIDPTQRRYLYEYYQSWRQNRFKR